MYFWKIRWKQNLFFPLRQDNAVKAVSPKDACVFLAEWSDRHDCWWEEGGWFPRKRWCGGAGRFSLPGGVSWRKRDRGAVRGWHRDSLPRVILLNCTSGLQVRGTSLLGRFLPTHERKCCVRFTGEQKIGFISHCGTSGVARNTFHSLNKGMPRDVTQKSDNRS